MSVEAPPAAPDMAQNVFNPRGDGAPSTSSPASFTDDDDDFVGGPTGDTPPKSSDAPPPDAPPPDSQPHKKKSGLDRVGALKKPDAKPPEGQAATDGKPPKPSAEDNIKILRQAKEEWDRVKPEYEKIKGDYETTRKELEKLKALGLNERERQEFVRYRNMNAVEAVKSSDEYRRDILVPIQQRVAKINTVAENAKLNDQAKSALLDACDIPDEWKRNKSIRAALQNAELELDDFTSLSEMAINAAKELQEVYYPKEDEVLARAHEVQMASRAKDQHEAHQRSQKETMELKKAHDDVWGILSSDKLKPILEEKDLAIEGIRMEDAMRGAEPATNPTDRAFEVQAAAAMPFLIEYANRALAKAAQLEEAIRMRNGSSPNRNDGLGTPPKTADSHLPTAEEVFGRRR